MCTLSKIGTKIFSSKNSGTVYYIRMASFSFFRYRYFKVYECFCLSIAPESCVPVTIDLDPYRLTIWYCVTLVGHEISRDIQFSLLCRLTMWNTVPGS
jgi:hypothetical protein